MRTDKTHFTLTELAADTEYMIRIEAYERDDRETKQQCSQALSGQSDPAASESMLLCTGRQKKRLDITGAPYFAKGDGSTMGSEMSDGIHDVRIWDCDLSCGLYGIEIKGTRKRGGYVRDVQVRDCRVSMKYCENITFKGVTGL